MARVSQSIEPTTAATGPGASVRRRLTQAERTARSDERMFNSAIDLILRQGAHRATLREICENAGYSRGLATNRFGSKENFLAELLKHFNHVWTDHLQLRTREHRGIDALMNAIDGLAEFMIEQNRFLRGGYIIWYECLAGDNAIRTELAHNHVRYRADVGRWLREGVEDGTVRSDVNAEAFAAFYLSWVSGTVYQWLVDPDAIDLDGMFEHIRGVARRELQPESGAT